MEQVLKKAQEGGWKSTPIPEPYSPLLAMAYLDPNFWQALGKAMGWEALDNEKVLSVMSMGGETKGISRWHYYWHLFITHLADGEDAESFFNDLLI